jgi:hypothetical protein
VTYRLWTLLAALALLTFPLAGCPSDDDDDSSDDDDTTADDDDTTGDDDDTTGDDDDDDDDDDDSSAATVSTVTISVASKTADTRTSLALTITADWSDSATTNPTEADGVVVTLTNTAGTDSAAYAEPDIASVNAGTFDVQASYMGVDSNTLSISFTPSAILVGDLVVHELLVDGTAGDANGDTTIDADQDAFVEFLNTSGVELDLFDCTITERDFGVNLPRHTFDAGDSVLAGQAVVVFGGGSADVSPAGAFVTVADNAGDSGNLLALNLDPAGDIIEIRDPADAVIAGLSYGSEGTAGLPDANIDESITLSPQITGTAWGVHNVVAGSATALFSPGTQADGTAFPE